MTMRFAIPALCLLIPFLSQAIEIQVNPGRTVEVPQLPLDIRYEANAAELIVGERGITVEDLRDIAKSGRTDLIRDLFRNYGVNLACLPNGYAAGTAARVFAEQLPLPSFSLVLDALTGESWKGKQFIVNDATCETQRGNNRVFNIDQINFVTRIISPSEAKSRVAFAKVPQDTLIRSSAVELNYSKPTMIYDPATGGYSRENPLNTVLASLLNGLGVYDLTVAIPGKYGPVLVGLTWLGRYQTQGPNFEAGVFNGILGLPGVSLPEFTDIVAMFFLDFSDQALWDQWKESSIVERAFTNRILAKDPAVREAMQADRNQLLR